MPILGCPEGGRQFSSTAVTTGARMGSALEKASLATDTNKEVRDPVTAAAGKGRMSRKCCTSSSWTWGHMCIYIYIHMCLYIYIHMYIWLYLYIYIIYIYILYLNVCMNVCMYVWMYVYMYLCMYVWMYVCLYVSLSVCLSVRPSVCLSVGLSVRPSVCLSYPTSPGICYVRNWALVPGTDGTIVTVPRAYL